MLNTFNILLQGTDISFSIFSDLPNAFFLRFAIDLVTVFVLIRGVYYTSYKKTDLFLTFFSFNLVIFLVTFMLNKVNLSMGAAFGLFAVFSILRFRTEGIGSKDMTYLFLVIALGLISAVSVGTPLELLLLNSVILIVVVFIEKKIFFQREAHKKLIYDRPKLLAPNLKSELLEDIKTKTGFPIHRVEVLEIDLIKDSAHILIFYYD
jgi:hypothetical protein